jgi:hypothetical protein
MTRIGPHIFLIIFWTWYWFSCKKGKVGIWPTRQPFRAIRFIFIILASEFLGLLYILMDSRGSDSESLRKLLNSMGPNLLSAEAKLIFFALISVAANEIAAHFGGTTRGPRMSKEQISSAYFISVLISISLIEINGWRTVVSSDDLNSAQNISRMILLIGSIFLIFRIKFPFGITAVISGVLLGINFISIYFLNGDPFDYFATSLLIIFLSTAVCWAFSKNFLSTERPENKKPN